MMSSPSEIKTPFMKNSLRYFLTARDSSNRLTEQEPLKTASGGVDAEVSVLIDSAK